MRQGNYRWQRKRIFLAHVDGEDRKYRWRDAMAHSALHSRYVGVPMKTGKYMPHQGKRECARRSRTEGGQ